MKDTIPITLTATAITILLIVLIVISNRIAFEATGSNIVFALLTGFLVSLVIYPKIKEFVTVRMQK